MKSTPVLLLVVVGCGFPYQTRGADAEERAAIDELLRAISAQAESGGDPGDRAVAAEVQRAGAEGRIAIFEDDPFVGGYSSYGTTRLGRIYLYAGLFHPLSRQEALRVLYHEGVHLTQGWWRLITDAAGAEEEAIERQSDFLRRIK